MALIITYLITGIIFGFITRHVAQSKGYDGGFWWGFWLGIIGLLVVGFRPNIVTSIPQQSEYKPMYGGALQPEPKNTWTCTCGTKNSYRLDYCPICQKTRESAVKPDIECPHCGAKNNASRSNCVLCDRPLDGKEAIVHNVSSGTETSEDPIELLQRLADLHNQGILTDAEFSQKKTEILSKM